MGWDVNPSVCCHAPKFTTLLHPDQGKCELTEIAKQIDSSQRECGLNDAEKYEEMLNFGLVEVVYEWSRGMVSRRASEQGHTEDCFVLKGRSIWQWYKSVMR